ncbi:hypothetical protein SCP_0607420 [Sparassis crispa]|uniref:Uncharacterized protein n=1 Tax=Sparassis crispa TaxID=139825 RepID=A0A401GRB7_9APHY|nr:hypothetical protein SCP_0607420 [Sparassis crispa]GBE84762.1 hypothetical protein SCP_0607420 [Sparassis crispa]
MPPWPQFTRNSQGTQGSFTVPTIGFRAVKTCAANRTMRRNSKHSRRESWAVRTNSDHTGASGSDSGRHLNAFHCTSLANETSSSGDSSYAVWT